MRNGNALLTQQIRHTQRVLTLPRYECCLSETVRWHKQGKKYVLGKIEDMLGEMIGNDEGKSKFDAGGDNRQMAGAEACRCTVIWLCMVGVRTGVVLCICCLDKAAAALLTTLLAQQVAGCMSFMAETGSARTEDNGNQQNRQKSMKK